MIHCSNDLNKITEKRDKRLKIKSIPIRTFAIIITVFIEAPLWAGNRVS